jgi:ABC-2 type transport system permease protein
MGAASQGMQDMFTNTPRSLGAIDKALADAAAAPDQADRADLTRFLGELKSFVGRQRAPGADAGTAQGWKPVDVVTTELRQEREGPRSAYDITFPQAVLWGMIGCAFGFAISLVVERTRGTLTRLQMSPVSRAQVLAGKALACFTSVVLVQVLLFGVATAAFGVRPGSWVLLVLACLSLGAAFVGIMMVISVLGKTEQTVGGLAWAIMLPMSMLGGGMVPLFAMPAWMQSASSISPVKWGILALEGAIWRGFSPTDMLLPCGILVAVGVVGFTVGARVFRDAV